MRYFSFDELIKLLLSSGFNMVESDWYDGYNRVIITDQFGDIPLEKKDFYDEEFVMTLCVLLNIPFPS
jgi:hypothetical protein